MRCDFAGCKKKVTVFSGFDCSTCKSVYCVKHRLPMDHSCDMEKHIEKHIEILKKQNPVIEPKKMEFRI